MNCQLGPAQICEDSCGALDGFVLGFVRKIWLDLTATAYTVYTAELCRLGRICEDIEGGLGGQRPWPRLGGQQQPLI